MGKGKVWENSEYYFSVSPNLKIFSTVVVVNLFINITQFPMVLFFFFFSFAPNDGTAFACLSICVN